MFFYSCEKLPLANAGLGRSNDGEAPPLGRMHPRKASKGELVGPDAVHFADSLMIFLSVSNDTSSIFRNRIQLFPTSKPFSSER
jgi:hypothetical protein